MTQRYFSYRRLAFAQVQVRKQNECKPEPLLLTIALGGRNCFLDSARRVCLARVQGDHTGVVSVHGHHVGCSPTTPNRSVTLAASDPTQTSASLPSWLK
jgi:hypothetical protein